MYGADELTQDVFISYGVVSGDSIARTIKRKGFIQVIETRNILVFHYC